MTHLNEWAPIIREPTPEHAQNAIDSIVPTDSVTGLLPNIFNRLDNHESTEQIASDTLFNMTDIVENELTGGINQVFDIGIVERLASMVLGILNSVVERASELLLV